MPDHDLLEDLVSAGLDSQDRPGLNCVLVKQQQQVNFGKRLDLDGWVMNERILRVIVSYCFTVMTLSVAVFGQTISGHNYRRLQYWEHCQEVISPLETKPT